MVSNKVVLQFIKKFKEIYPKQTEEIFTHGLCYWFARILNIQFPESIIMYNQVENHFVTEIGSHLYDIRGNIDKLYKNEELILWKDYEKWDALDYKRVIKYCKDLKG